MRLITQPKIDSTGKITDTPSEYSPNAKEQTRMLDLQRDFERGEQIMNQSFEEFGNKDVTTYQNMMQKRFNNNIPPQTNDTNQSWRANTIRPLTRNKVISIVAHLTNSILYPSIVAQNDQSVEDKDMAIVMRDAVEWACEQAKYEDMFLGACVDMCINPAIIIEQSFSKVKRTIKDITDKDKWEDKEVVDELYSGFQNDIVPCDELFIGNAYEPNIQKQPFLIRVRNITFEDAETKYSHLDNWKYIYPGLRVFFNSDTGIYYEQSDESMEERLVQEVIYYNRFADLELRVINGVLMDNPDRPLQRKDKKYPFAKGYYEMFNSRFFYGMPLVAKIKPDQDVIDTLYNLIIDGTVRDVAQTYAVYGKEKVDSGVMVPGTTVGFKDPNTRIEAIGTPSNLGGAINVLNTVENSASESSQDPLGSGQQAGGDRTKYEVIRLETNARTVLGLTGKMIGGLVRDFGNLIVPSIVQYMAIAEISEVVGDDVRLKFPTLFLTDRDVDGVKKNRRIEFTDEMPTTKEEKLLASQKLWEEEDKTGMSIYKVRPEAFRKMKYLVKIEPDFLDMTTKFFKKLQLYDRAVQNPLANQEAIYRDFLLGAYVPGEEDKYIAEAPKPMENEMQKMMGQRGMGETAVTEQPQNQFVNKTTINSPTQEQI